jgi:protein-S-isoprenylcysteine O-methyltransferase Ste14
VDLSGTLIALAAIPISALLWGLFTGCCSAGSRLEEQNLRGVFGDAYQQYGARVGRWL